jgi:hypothetical protein
MATLLKAMELPKQSRLRADLKDLVAYTTEGEIICSANSPVELSKLASKVKPGVRYHMATKAAILNQGPFDFGWID